MQLFWHTEGKAWPFFIFGHTWTDMDFLAAMGKLLKRDTIPCLDLKAGKDALEPECLETSKESQILSD
jgi:hypothetical protein